MEADFYEKANLAEFDSTVEQFKAQLRECVRDEWVSEMARLREENAKYADIKARWAEIEAERRMEREEVERVKNSAKSGARYARMEELFADVCFSVYTIREEDKLLPWCGKCDSSRHIHHKSPVTGADMSENCPVCGRNVTVFSPQELRACEAKMCNHYASFNSLKVWYRKPDDEDGYLHLIQEFDDDKSFKDIKRYNAFFKSRERCQAYCDLLNELERGQKEVE